MSIGEYDKRLVILTREKGKISAFAKGARRQNSSLIAGSRPFSFGEFTIYKGRNSFNIVSMNIMNYFTELSQDFYGAYYGFYFLELCDYFGRENIDGRDTVKLLYYTLKALSNDSIDNKLIRYIFELKLCVINGEYPEMYTCLSCGSDKEIRYFSPGQHGLICKNCKRISNEVVELNTSTIYTMQYIISTPIEKLYTFKVSKNVINELAIIMNRYQKLHTDKTFKSLEILEKILNLQ